MFLAEDTLLRRRVAIKFSRDPHSQMDRLLREARAASQLDHPNIARVYEAGTTAEGELFVVMEFVDGETLASEIARGPLSASRAREVISQLLAALAHAHGHQIIHRDIKPANIMLAGRTVKVLDFGLAKQVTTAAAAASQSTTVTQTAASTQPGAIMGTPAYMSPEQLTGNGVDLRTDIFACGVVLYQCLTGRLPFAGHGPTLHGAILHADPAPPSGVDPLLAAVALKALHKRPQDRFQSAGEMAAALAEDAPSTSTQTHLVWLPKPASWFGATLLVLLLVVGWWATRPAPAIPAPAAQRWYQQGLEALRDGTYYSAARAFEEVTRADPAFVLGHARLAEAWSELDSLEKAQRELLLARRATSDWRRRAPEVELTVSAIESLVLRDFPAAAECYRRLLSEAPAADQAPVWLDIGRAQQKLNENAAAVESYTKAISLDPAHAAGWLLRGVVQGMRQQFALAAADFAKARQIFEASQNFEGQAELAFQQGRLSTMAKDLPAARASLTRALDLASKSGDEFHQIRAMSQLSIVTYMEGDAGAAQALAETAAARARAARMPYLTATAMVDIANAQLNRLDLASAETTLLHAISLARNDGLQRSEARARLSLGSVFVQAVRDQEALPHIQAAVDFYSKGQSRAEIAMSRVLLGRVYRRRGEFEKVHSILSEALREAEAAGARSKVSDTLGEIASVYIAQEKFADALTLYDRRFEMVKDSKAVTDIGYSLAGKAAMLLRLGAFDAARAAMEDTLKTAAASEAVSRRVRLLRLDAHYRAGQWIACANGYREVLLTKQPSVESELESTARRIECLSAAGNLGEARQLVVRSRTRPGLDEGGQGATWLRVVSALVEFNPATAGPFFNQAIEQFHNRQQFESLWMAESILASAYRRARDPQNAELHAKASEVAWSSHEARLPAPYRQGYQLMPLVVHYRRKGN